MLHAAHNQSFDSIDDSLINATSNSIVNIRSDAMLSSHVLLEGLENNTIIGYGNPTVNCDNVGGIAFVSCKNVTIVGVNLERCGYGKSIQELRFTIPLIF